MLRRAQHIYEIFEVVLGFEVAIIIEHTFLRLQKLRVIFGRNKPFVLAEKFNFSKVSICKLVPSFVNFSPKNL